MDNHLCMLSNTSKLSKFPVSSIIMACIKDNANEYSTPLFQANDLAF